MSNGAAPSNDVPAAAAHAVDLMRDLAACESRPLTEWLSWIAGRLSDRMGLRVVEFLSVDVDTERSRPLSDALVFYGASDRPAGSVSGGPASALTHFGRPAVLADLRPLTSALVEGPHEDVLRPLREGESCLIVRMHLSVRIVWVRLIMPTSRLRNGSPSELVAIVDGFVRAAMRFVDPPGASSAAGRRQRFYARLLGMQASDALWADLARLCAEWTQTTDADWAWLWMFNRITGRFEPVACHARAEETVIKPPDEMPGATSACDCCARLGRPIFVEDVRTWTCTVEGKRYAVACTEELLELGAAAFDVVPIRQPEPERFPGSGIDEAMTVTGVVTLHYRDSSRRFAQPESSLSLMGQLTGLRIHTWRSERRGEVLHTLNRLAQRHLTKVHRRQQEVRREYLNDVIDLIRDRLHVRSVSIFYARENEDAVECIATTGLWDLSEDRLIRSEDRLAEVVYAAGENWTGECFRTGRPIIRDAARRDTSLPPKYADAVDGQPVLTGVSLQHPIPVETGEGEGPAAIGVIRCSGHVSPLFPDRDRGFDAMDLRLINFIAQQLAPVLTTIAGRIKREREISIVKHDLYTPLNMIRDITARIDRRWTERGEVREYDVRNLAFCERTASNLVDRLSLDLMQMPALAPEPTRLAGNIIARLKNMMSDFAQFENRMTIRYGQIDDVVPTLRIDRELIERAIYNLLVNAVKYGAPQTEIDIEARSGEAGWFLDISNVGIGLRPEEIPHLFKAEYRSPRAEALAQGVGLGLTIAQRAVEAHGGTISAKQVGERTTFTIFLPKALKMRNPG